MPTERPENDFYRDPKDPKHVVRATLDNMPVLMADTTVRHTMLQHRNHRRPRPRKSPR